MPTRLTSYSHGAGCGCKLDPARLAQVIARLAPARHPDLLVGTGDDAAVWRLDDDRALVFTTDFFTPIVDDPRTWGRIAATNAASDVYAMGGRPLLALNLVAWPVGELGEDVLVEVLEGGAEAAAAGGWLTVGGHSIDDPEPKYGQAVVGEVAPADLLTQRGLQEGQALVLTKPLGTGLVATALKRGNIDPAQLDAAVASMTTLNDRAAAAARAAGATAATDVTGFGLLGHLHQMAAASGVDVVVEADAVPLLPGALDLLRAGAVSGGTRRNLAYVAGALAGGDERTRLLLADAQTSGGLLFGCDPHPAAGAAEDLGGGAAVIGRVSGPGSGRIAIAGNP